MSFLTLNGYEIPIQDGDWEESPEEIGAVVSRSAGLSAQLQRHTRAYKRMWSGSSSLLAMDEAEAATLWIEGQMWHVSFDRGLQSAGALCPDRGYAGVIASAPKFGTRCLYGASGASLAKYRFPVLTRSNDWTVALWYQDAGNGWHHHLVRSVQGSVAQYTDGAAVGAHSTVVVDSPTSNAIRAELVAVLPNGSASTQFRIDDLVLAAWPMTDLQMDALVQATRAFSEAPILELAGDVIEETGPLYVRGFVEESELVQVGTAYYRRLKFHLVEV